MRSNKEYWAWYVVNLIMQAVSDIVKPKSYVTE